MDDQQQIRLNHVTVSYPGTTSDQLHDMVVQAAAHQIIGIVGPSNAGKTTLCRLLSGIIPQVMRAQVSGTWQVSDLEPTVQWSTINQLVGYVFQNPADQLSGMAETVAAEIAFSLINLGQSDSVIQATVARIAAQFHLTGQLQQAPTMLSGGQLQRLAIASALVADPDILIFDDPTSQMDPIGTTAFFNWLKTQNDKTIFVTSTNLDELCETVDELWVLVKGHLIDAGQPRAVFNRGTTDHIIPAPTVFRLAQQMHWTFQNGDFPVTQAELREVKINEH